MAAESTPKLGVYVSYWEEPDEWGISESSPPVSTLDEAIQILLDHKGAAEIEIFDAQSGGSVIIIRSTAEGFTVSGECRSRELFFNSDGSTHGYWDDLEDLVDPQDDDSQS